MGKKILAIVQHRKGRSPGQRFRFEQYLPYLESNGYEITFSNIISEKDDAIFYSKGHYFKKLLIVVKSFFHRLKDVKRASLHDIVFIYREAYMLGTTYFEKKMSKKNIPIVFDFDDSIWLNDTSEGNKKLAWMKKPEKTSEICQLSNLVMIGNQYLADYSKKFNQNVMIVPTTIDMNYHIALNKTQEKEKICIGWTGTTTTLKHFDTAIPILKKIKEKYQNSVYFKVIVDSDEWKRDIEVKLVKWTKKSEIDDLSEFDIGIMPLPDDDWSKGKCGFKGLQCMSMKIPVVMSPVGMNNDLIKHGENGFLANTQQEWFDYLCELIDSFELRQKIGARGYETVKDNYSVEVWEKKVYNAFENLINKQGEK